MVIACAGGCILQYSPQAVAKRFGKQLQCRKRLKGNAVYNQMRNSPSKKSLQITAGMSTSGCFCSKRVNRQKCVMLSRDPPCLSTVCCGTLCRPSSMHTRRLMSSFRKWQLEGAGEKRQGLERLLVGANTRLHSTSAGRGGRLTTSALTSQADGGDCAEFNAWGPGERQAHGLSISSDDGRADVSVCHVRVEWAENNRCDRQLTPYRTPNIELWAIWQKLSSHETTNTVYCTFSFFPFLYVLLVWCYTLSDITTPQYYLDPSKHSNALYDRLTWSSVLLFSNFYYIIFGYFDPDNIFLDNKNNIFRVELTDISAKKEALITTLIPQ